MERDQFLTEMMGECWHEPIEENIEEARYDIKSVKVKPTCKCGFSPSIGELYCLRHQNNFTTPADAYRLMQFVMAQDWWNEFGSVQMNRFICADSPVGSRWGTQFIKWLLSDPDRFASLVAEYRGYKEDKG